MTTEELQSTMKEARDRYASAVGGISGSEESAYETGFFEAARVVTAQQNAQLQRLIHAT